MRLRVVQVVEIPLVLRESVVKSTIPARRILRLLVWGNFVF